MAVLFAEPAENERAARGAAWSLAAWTQARRRLRRPAQNDGRMSRSAVIEQHFNGRYALYVDDRLVCVRDAFEVVHDLAILYQHGAQELLRRHGARRRAEERTQLKEEA